MLCIGILMMWCNVQQPVQPATAGAMFCDTAKPFLWSAKDTRMTKEQADIHNRKGKRLCRWGVKQ